MRIVRFLGADESRQSIEILRDAVGRMGSMGEHAWCIDEAFEREQLLAAIGGELVGGFDAKAMTCTMRLQAMDPLYWPAAKSGDALYLHKLAVRRDAAGTGWPSDMVGFAVRQARTRNIPEIRIDTYRPGPLPAIYEKLGFSMVGPAPNSPEIVLMRMQLLLPSQ